MNGRKIEIVTTLLVLFLTILPVFMSQATEEYAENTGKDCLACHIDPLGGGDLTELGQGYRLSVEPVSSEEKHTGKTISGVFRLIAGYLHVITAFMWFGTILYVHLVLKPAYASKGLPRGEVKVGLISMFIMAITGIVLTYYKVPSVEVLVSSKFGILLLAKISIFTVMVLSALFVVLVLGPRLRNKKALPLSESEDLTLLELSGFDGEEGRPAYIAFKGKIYDVSGSTLWKNGEHMKRHQAGDDLTAILSQAPHGEDKILALPEVGRLSMKKEASPHELHKRVFYCMAYMNLGFVFIISFILALWRWY